jgi:flagellar basal-body rod protein FlgG
MIQSLASHMQVQWRRQELLANNLANASTTGYKQDDLVVFARQVPPGSSTPTGAHVITPWTDFAPGLVETTGRPLDVALGGPGFLVVQTPRGVRYTRAGTLTTNADGLVVTPNGYPVMGEGGAITVRSGQPAISPKGEIQDGGRTVDTLRVVDFPTPYRLVKDGDGLFAPADPGAAPAPAKDPQVISGALEQSNVSTVRTMVDMIEMLRSYESAQRAIQAADEADRYAANDMGRV